MSDILLKSRTRLINGVPISRRIKKIDELRANQKIFEDKVFAYGSLKSSPLELLCRWCRRFVGIGASFCSITCHAKFTRTRRRRFINFREATSDTQINREATKSIRTNTPVTSDSGLVTKTPTELQPNTTARMHQPKDPFVCEYCTRQLIYPGSQFCDRACETRKRQLIKKIVEPGTNKRKILCITLYMGSFGCGSVYFNLLCLYKCAAWIFKKKNKTYLHNYKCPTGELCGRSKYCYRRTYPAYTRVSRVTSFEIVEENVKNVPKNFNPYTPSWNVQR